MDNQALLLGIVFILIGVFIVVKTWNVGWDEVIRAIIWQARERKAYFKWVGLALTAAGVVTILAGLGII
jgi:hypothetical protein